MPIPSKKSGETTKAFVKRCMSDKTMLSEYPGEKQRYAICLDNVHDSDATFSDYPQAATDNAKKALKFLRESGNPNNCLTAVGFARANQLAKRESISLETVKRMAAFIRHEQYKNVPYEDGCGGVAWDAWGGTEGINWAINKVKA